MHNDTERVLLTEQEIAARVRQLGEEISRDYAGKEPLVVGILKGAVIFMADLVRCLSIPVRMDFMAVSSYGASSQSSGVVRILKDLEHNIGGMDVLLVEDIVDTGLTLNYLRENLLTRGPASLKICTLLDKPGRRRVNVPVDYNGFIIPDEFVVGYGLDYNGRYRHLRDIMILKREVYTAKEDNENCPADDGS
ncbi:hypoxanthine phosphoribosyltransferase [Desulfofundulus thermobenzoicus]|uniref:Hypoxanthine phosphoribosyltransferase n=1 Tax=Desulfofundulus thermobenzoicus TaxID=29376 RepID=A0A6N7IU88_9FIRM|nr:hypoxanthine phosphoribosyltransferase [Desulfofundulus thermobenzoicus]MQL53471.1 hypoxanthine phosphoribosyltransferase [Desulfofundulus thermobenzoicus]HHW44002.1 hypoxanthine phosphoribosyltransferase [Desulfotomaculum sp.]